MTRLGEMLVEDGRKEGHQKGLEEGAKAYFLGVFGIIPEVRVLNFPVYFFEAPSFAVDVKDTPEVH